MITSLSDVVETLRVLHRSLLFALRDEYEAKVGRIEGPWQLLHIASTHPMFASLRPLSEFIVDLDLLLEELPPGASEPTRAVAEELRALLGLAGEDTPFARRYRELLQQDPHIVVAHAQLLEVLRALPVRGDEAALLHERHQWAMVRRHRYPESESAATLGLTDGPGANGPEQ